MSYQALTWARKVRTGSPTVKAVLMAVANYADEAGACFPSQLQLAEDTELSRHSVMRCLDTLEEMGAVNRERRHRQDGSRSSDLITLNLSSTELRSCEQRSRQQRSCEQQPKSQAATALTSTEPSPCGVSAPERERVSRGTRMSPDWKPRQAEIGWALARGWTPAEVDDQAERFRDYWLDRTGRGATKINWDRTFLNRLKELHDRRKPHQRPFAPRDKGQRLHDALDRNDEFWTGATLVGGEGP